MSLHKYFKLKEDIDSFKQSYDTKDKIFTGGKILAKGIANVGIYMVNEMPYEYAKQVLRSNVSSEAQKERARRILEKQPTNQE